MTGWLLTLATATVALLAWRLPTLGWFPAGATVVAGLAHLALPLWWKRANGRVIGILVAVHAGLLIAAGWSWSFDPYVLVTSLPALALIWQEISLVGLIVVLWGTGFRRVGWVISAVLAVASIPFGLQQVSAAVKTMLVQPGLHFELGRVREDEEMGYTIVPYSRARHYYPTNPRGFFADDLEGASSYWRAWQLRRHLDHVLPAVPKFINSAEEHRVQLDPGPTGIPNTEVDWSFQVWRLHEEKENRFTFKARSNKERPLELVIRGLPEFKPLYQKSYLLTRDWQQIEVRLPPAPAVSEANITMSFGASTVPVELVDPTLTQEGEPTEQDPRIHRYYVEYQMNDVGFRMDTIPHAKPAGTKRIVCLGDSFTFGQGVQTARTYCDLLSKELGRASEWSVPIEVINAGRCGLATGEERACFLREAAAYEPDLVVLQMNDNDTEDHVRRHHLPNPNEEVRTYRECVDEAIQLAKEAESRGARMVVFLFRLSDLSPRWAALKQGLKRLPPNVSVYDLGERIARHEGAAGRPYWYWCVHPCDQHPNEFAHAEAAKFLAEKIMGQDLLVIKGATADSRGEERATDSRSSAPRFAQSVR